MAVYVFLVLLVLLLNILSSKQISIYNTDNTQKRYYFFACIIIILVIGLRSIEVGSDTIVYVHTFNKCKLLSWREILQISYRDPGFYIFTKILTYICLGKAWLYLVVMAILSCFGIFQLIYQTSSKPIVSLFFWITLTTFMFIQTGMRQAVAMSLCAYSVQYISLKKWKIFVFVVLIAATIHHSALLFLPVIICGYTNFNNIYIALSIMIMIISHYLYQYIFTFANMSLIYDYSTESIDNGLIYFLILFIINYISYYTRNKWMTTLLQKDLFFLSIFCLILWNLRLIDRMAERPSMYFMCAIPSVLTNSLVKGITNDKRKNILLIIAIVLSFLLFLKRIYKVNYYFTDFS